jgi:hypothetical protein
VTSSKSRESVSKPQHLTASTPGSGGTSHPLPRVMTTVAPLLALKGLWTFWRATLLAAMELRLAVALLTAALALAAEYPMTFSKDGQVWIAAGLGDAWLSDPGMAEKVRPALVVSVAFGDAGSRLGHHRSFIRAAFVEIPLSVSVLKAVKIKSPSHTLCPSN